MGAGLLALLLLLQPLSVSADTPSEPPFAEGWAMTFDLVPVHFWDAPEGPYGHELGTGTVRLYRQGSYEVELTGQAGEPMHIPPGTWLWTAESPGFVSTMTNLIRVPEGTRDERGLIVPMTPACLVSLSEDRRWQALDRLDVVSIDEAAVYPVVPDEDRDFWIPRGNHLAYGVDNGTIRGISSIGFCKQHDEVALGYPEPPAADKQSLVVTARLPWDFEAESENELVVELEDAARRARPAPPLSPDARYFQGPNLVSFFLDVEAARPFSLSVRHPWLRAESAPVLASPGTVREVDLGDLLERRRLEVSVDYQPAQEHRSAILELRYCGGDRTSYPPMLLLNRCGEPVEEHVLEPGFQTYDFPNLDDGQYLVSAKVDGELIPGLGQRIMSYLEPGSEAVPTEAAELKEMHVYGSLSVAEEPVSGAVHLSPWAPEMMIPPRTFPTDHRDEYHLYYFARYPTAGEVEHFPEELSGESPEDLPGLYCCFKLSACGDHGACRTFNIHSAFTGEGRFDIELPGEEVVEISAVDASTGESLEQARVLVPPSKAFHFVDGELLWHEALGAEPDSLEMDAGGEVMWLPPSPGEQRLSVGAPGYVTEHTSVDVPSGGTVALTVELEKERYVQGARLLFSDGEPVAHANLLAFDENGQTVPGCRISTDVQGRAAPPESCSDHSFVLVHGWAALQMISGLDLVASAVVEVDSRPAFPLRVRLVDAGGEPLPKVMLQVRLGDLTLSPNEFTAAGVPAYTSNSVGEIVLTGLETGALSDIEISPWLPYEEQWVDLAGAKGEIEIVVERGD